MSEFTNYKFQIMSRLLKNENIITKPAHFKIQNKEVESIAIYKDDIENFIYIVNNNALIMYKKGNINIGSNIQNFKEELYKKNYEDLFFRLLEIFNRFDIHFIDVVKGSWDRYESVLNTYNKYKVGIEQQYMTNIEITCDGIDRNDGTYNNFIWINLQNRTGILKFNFLVSKYNELFMVRENGFKNIMSYAKFLNVCRNNNVPPEIVKLIKDLRSKYKLIEELGEEEDKALKKYT